MSRRPLINTVNGGSLVLSGREFTCKCRRLRFDPWVRKIPWRRKWQPLHYFCLGSPMDRGAWWATFHGVTKELDMI